MRKGRYLPPLTLLGGHTMINVTKKNEAATNLIKEFVLLIDAESILNNAEKKFIDLPFSMDQLSLTDKQPIDNQLRFYEKNYGLTVVNNIALKCVQQLSESNHPLEINMSELSEVEVLFLERLSQYMINSENLHLKFNRIEYIEKVEISKKELKRFLNIADPWTAIKIGEILLQKRESQKDLDLLHILALNYNSIGNTLAAEDLLLKVIHSEVSSVRDNKIIISSFYILAMTHLRHHPNGLKDMMKAQKYLDKALELMKDDNFAHDDRKFSSIFNRNGYALILFNEGRVDEAISLLIDKLIEIEPLIKEKGEYILLHKTVLLYNLYQCYVALDRLDEAESTLKKLIQLDYYDLDYRYELVRFYFNINNLEQGKVELDQISKLDIEDYPTHQSYLGFYYLEKNDLPVAKEHYANAYHTNVNAKKANEFLYNYLYTLYALHEFDEVSQIGMKCRLYGITLEKEIGELIKASESSLQS